MTEIPASRRVATQWPSTGQHRNSDNERRVTVSRTAEIGIELSPKIAKNQYESDSIEFQFVKIA